MKTKTAKSTKPTQYESRSAASRAERATRRALLVTSLVLQDKTLDAETRSKLSAKLARLDSKLASLYIEAR